MDVDGGRKSARDEAESRRVSERIVSAIARRLSMTQAEAIDPAIELGLSEVARHIGADGAALLRTLPDESIEFVRTWFDPAFGPLRFRTDRKATQYDWIKQRLTGRGPQVVDVNEIVARVGPVSTASSGVRHVGLIGTYAGAQLVGALCFYYRNDLFRPEVAHLEPFEVLGDILLGCVSRRDAELALRASEQRYRTIVETSSEGIWTITPDMRVSFANGRIAKMLGYSVDEIVGRPLLDFIHESAHEQSKERIRRHEHGWSEVVSTLYRRRDGSTIHVRVAPVPITDGSGQYIGALAMVQDVTEELRLQAELAGARRLEAVGRLAGGVAHDINNALTVILAHATQGQRVAQGEALRSFESIASAAGRASEVAHQLLTFARREPIQPRALDVGSLVGGLVPMLAQLVGEHIRVETEIADDRWSVLADPLQLERVVMNLAANARDAMPEGGKITIRIGNHTVADAGGVAPGDYVTIAVIDTGHGMSEEVQAKLFDPFFTTKPNGSGLGLASAYGAMKQFGGGIGVRTAPGAGTCITLFCPRTEQPIEAEIAAQPDTDATLALRILYVEDLEPLRNIIAETLVGAGHVVVTAANGEEALNVAERDGHPIDMLVTDVVLPRMNGYRLARAMRGTRSQLRVLYLSGYDRPQGLDEALADPGTGFLAKPFSPDALAAAITQLATTALRA